MNSEERIIPTHASSFFSISRDGEFHQLLQYDYYDPDEYYSRLERDDFLEEIRKLWLNMQNYLEEETNKVNGVMVYPKVEFCDIQFRGRPQNPFIIWTITFKGDFQIGLNKYETKTDEEELEYDCYVIWQFPEKTKKILKVDTKLYYDIFGNRIVLWGEKGMKIGGFERIHFELV
ncbi:MAG: hypothetical protein HWN66_14205 [Candidatus Helarchaeota archaeon]|nr:hypothetical protein [Candidatus Helarchaeota archaeon]